MQLSVDQAEALDKGEPVWLSVDNRDCVLLSRQAYEQVRALIEDWDPSTMRHHMARMMIDDWGDPAMSVYDE